MNRLASTTVITQLLVVIVVVPVVGYIVRKHFSPKRVYSGEQAVASDAPHAQPQPTDGNWSFVAMRYYNLISNRTYKVWVTPKYLCGLRIDHVIASPTRYDKIGPRWQNPEDYSDPDLESKYANIDLESDAFLEVDKANFRIPRTDVVDVKYYPKKWGMGRVPYSGRLVVKISNGHKVEFILVGRQDADAIRQRLLQI